jgi:ketosteroid isomerase-like protein
MDKTQFKNFFEPVGKMVKTMKFTITGSTVEDGRVALEAQGKADLANGKIYENKYHFLFECRDGNIIAAREYADSAPAIAAFFAP